MFRVNKPLAQGIAGEQRIEKMVAPLSGDAQIGPGIALPNEADPLEQPDRGDIAGQAGRLDAAQAQRLEDEGRKRPSRQRSCGPCRRRAPPSSSRAMWPGRRRA